MNPQQLQAAAAAMMADRKGGGQGGGGAFPPGGHPASFTVDGRSEPMGLSEVAGMRGFGNQVDDMNRPDEGPTGTSPMDFGAIMRRLLGNMGGGGASGGIPPQINPGMQAGMGGGPPGGMPPEGVMGPSSGPLLDIIRLLTQGTNRGRVEEDSPLWNPATMGNRMGARP